MFKCKLNGGQTALCAMNDAGQLRLPEIAARVDSNKAAAVLGFHVMDIPVLVKKGLLKPLGHPVQNQTKWFCALALIQLSKDEKWLSRATDVVANHIRQKNASQRARKQSAQLDVSHTGLTRG